MSTQEYIECYNRLARDDLKKPFEPHKYLNRYLPLRRFIGDVKGKRVLDVGCGDGSFLDLLNVGNGEKIGVDIAWPYIKLARSKGLKVFFHDAENPFPSMLGKFDVVILSDILEHVLNPQRVIQNVSKVLNPNGVLCVVIPWNEDLSFYRKYDGKYPYTHLRSFNWDSIKILFKDFRILKSEGVIPKCPPAGLKRLIYFCFSRFPPRLRDFLLIYLLRFEPVHMMILLKPIFKGDINANNN